MAGSSGDGDMGLQHCEVPPEKDGVKAIGCYGERGIVTVVIKLPRREMKPVRLSGVDEHYHGV